MDLPRFPSGGVATCYVLIMFARNRPGKYGVFASTQTDSPQAAPNRVESDVYNCRVQFATILHATAVVAGAQSAGSPVQLSLLS